MSLNIEPKEVFDTLKRHLLVDGFHIVVDLEKSRGCKMVDARDGKEYIDFYAMFASQGIDFNHPRLHEPAFLQKLEQGAIHKIANSDVYTTLMAEFVEAFARYIAHPKLPHYFFIDGGSLAVENALKAAFDWKVRKNFQKGYKEEKGSQVIHFRQAFHGRTGYTMSLTNTDPTKTDYFPKFPWPRISNPRIEFPVTPESTARVQRLEDQAIDEIGRALKERKDDIAALIIEPIQGEGGDNHFRGEFLRRLRTVTEENELLFIVDEVQTGVAATGKMWCFEHFDFVPDIVAFGKKTQVCGIMASERINEVDSVFKVSSRINSTWGGNITDMVRAAQIFQIIHDEKLVDNARVVGDHLLQRMNEVAARAKGKMTSVRGRGLFCAFDLASTEERNRVAQVCWENGLAVLKSGTQSIRFRPSLSITPDVVDQGVAILAKAMGV